jgi:hypothetical protein
MILKNHESWSIGLAISSHFALLPNAMEQRTGRDVADCY